MQYEQFERSFLTIQQMMRDRKYSPEKTFINPQSEELMTKENFANFPDDIIITFDKKNGQKIMIMWHLKEGVGISVIQECCKKIQEFKATSTIIVKTGKLTASANAALGTDVTKHIQVFDTEELLNNVTMHSLVPKHELMSRPEQDKLLNMYKVTRIQLPRIMSFDPIVKYYGWPKGHIVKITRKGGEVYYRCIV